MTWIGQLDVIVLAGMIGYVVAAVVRVSYHRHAALHAEGIDTAHAADRDKLIADVGIQVANLKSIASVAPFLGLVGTCLGILSTFRGYSGPPEGFVVMVASGMSSALMTTVAGLLVAMPATWAHNYARTCIDSLQTKLSGAPALKEDISQVAQRRPLTKRFSQLPAYALIAAPSLAIGVAAFAMFASFRATRLRFLVVDAEHGERGLSFFNDPARMHRTERAFKVHVGAELGDRKSEEPPFKHAAEFLLVSRTRRAPR
jgi:hypothetical protein